MYRLAFLGAAILLFGVTVFNYYQYPKRWRNKKWFRILLKILHILGMTSLALVFTMYRYLPYEWLKWTVSRWASLYLYMTLLIEFGFLVRMAVVGIYRLIMKIRKLDIKDRPVRKIADKRTHSFAFFVIAFIIATTGFVNIGILRATSYDVRIHKNSVNDHLTVALIADVHAGAGTWRMTYADLTRKLQDTQCDVLLIAGDVFDETTSDEDIRYFTEALKTVKPKYGKFFVYGNHDDYHEDWAADVIRAMDVTVLKDEMVTIAGDVQLIGRLDPIDNRMELDELFDTLPLDTEKPILMLTHRPKEFRKMSEEGCDLVTAGHTHGYNIPDAPLISMLNDVVYGMRTYGDMTAVVTSGVSAWGFHYKFPAISEVVTIHLSFD